MIQHDEDKDPWLLCDICIARTETKPHYYDLRINNFYAIGLSTAPQVRGAAKTLKGWQRRKLITRLDPLESTWFDLCPTCQQPEILGMRLVAIAAGAPFFRGRE